MNMPTLNPWINMGVSDRFVRMVLGIALISVAWLFEFTWPFWGGVLLLITAAVRVCPIYALFKISSLSLDPAKTVIPWEEFLDLLPPKPEAPVEVVAPVQRSSKAEVVIPPVTFSLPPELTQALINDVERNALDEILVVRFYENFFGCKITIGQSGHLSSYECRFPQQTLTLNFAKLKAQLLARLKETAQVAPH